MHLTELDQSRVDAFAAFVGARQLLLLRVQATIATFGSMPNLKFILLVEEYDGEKSMHYSDSFDVLLQAR